MSAGKITEFVTDEALAELDALYKKLGITTQAMVDATAAAAKFNNEIGNVRTISEFTAASEKASGAMDNVKAAQQQVTAVQKEAVIQTQAVVEAVKAKAIAEVDASKILTQLNGTTEANIKVLVEQKAQLAQVNAELKEHSKITALSAESVSSHQAKTVRLTKAQIELKESTAQLNLLVRQQTKEQLAAANSNDYLTAQLNQARKALNGMSESERETTVAGKELTQTVEMLAAAVASNNEKQLKFTDSVGNYKKALEGAEQKQTAFGKAISRVTDVSQVGAMAVQMFTRMLLRMAAFTLVFEGIGKLYEWIKGLDIFTGRLVETTQKMEAMNEAMKGTDYTGAIQNVQKLTEDIKLAKEGFLDKKKVLNEYNNILGATIGYTDNLNDAEKSLIDHGEAYIKMSLLKASAQIALQKAAKAEAEAAEIANTPPDQSFHLSDLLHLNSSMDDKQGQKDRHARLKEDQQSDIQDKKDSASLQLKIFKDFQSQAAQIAKDNKFDFFDGTQDDKTGKPKKDNSAKKANQDELNNIKARVEREKALAKTILDDENQSYEARLKALQVFIDRSNSLIDMELKVANQAPGISNTAKDTNSVKADTQRDQLQVEQNAQKEKLRKDDIEKHRKAIEDLLKTQKDLADKAIALAQNQSDQQLDVLDKQRSKEETALSEKYAKGKIDEKKYRDGLLKINDQYNVDRLGQIAVFEQTKLEILQAQEKNDLDASRKKGATPEQIADIQDKSGVTQQQHTVAKAGVALSDAVNNQTLHGNKPDTDKQKEIAEAVKDAQEIQVDASRLIQSEYEHEISLLERKAQLIDQNANIEKAQVEAGVGSQRAKAQKLAQIEADAAAQKKAIQAEINKIKRKEAIEERIAAETNIIENTAVAVTKVTAQAGLLGLLTGVPAVIALGAIQAAAVAAAPLPAFKGGTSSSPEGLAHVGEAGPELRIEPTGQMSITPGKDTITYLKKGTKIFSNEELVRMMGKPEQINYVGGQAIDINKVIEAQRETTKAIKGLNTARSGTGISKTAGWNEYLKRTGLN